MVLLKILHFFSSFYCGLNRLGKCFCCYSRKEKGVFLTLKSQSLIKKVEILVFFQRGWGWSIGQKLKFFPCFYFWQNQPAKCIILMIIILERKKRSF